MPNSEKEIAREVHELLLTARPERDDPNLIKAALFGLASGLIACYKGISARGGPAGVGNAVNETVVYTFVALFAINIIVTAVGVKVML